MTSEYNLIWFIINGVWTFITSSWILAVPLALFIMYHSLRFIKQIFLILRQKGG